MPTAFADDDLARRALLPAGLSDDLPPTAEHRARVVGDLMAAFASFGYERVDPPLVEFEDSLLPSDGDGSDAMADQTFRLMDPISQRMMGVRADMTVQVARIATTRLGGVPRPLRLSYAGQVLRVRGTQLRPERQIVQAGVELIGASGVGADVEVVRLAVEALTALGLTGLSVDLNCAPMVRAILRHHRFKPREEAAIRAALDRKDANAVARIAGALSGAAATALGGLLAATGPARASSLILTTLDLPDPAVDHRARLDAVATALLEQIPGLTLTVDPVENRGFEYYTGVGFTLFARGVRGELGRGGRYVIADSDHGEPATGFSLYLDSLIEALPPPAPARRLYIPFGGHVARAHSLRAEGWATVAGLEPSREGQSGDANAEHAMEARRLGCQAILIGDAVVDLEDAS